MDHPGLYNRSVPHCHPEKVTIVVMEIGTERRTARLRVSRFSAAFTALMGGLHGNEDV